MKEWRLHFPITIMSRVFDVSRSGFYTWLKDDRYQDPRQVFRVTDGLLHITGDGLGALTTKKAYRDYHLVLEFKWGPRVWGNRKDRTRDSGLLVHSNGPDGGYNGIWMPSIEVQIIEGGMGDYILVAGVDKDGKPEFSKEQMALAKHDLLKVSRIELSADGRTAILHVVDLKIVRRAAAPAARSPSSRC